MPVNEHAQSRLYLGTVNSEFAYSNLFYFKMCNNGKSSLVNIVLRSALSVMSLRISLSIINLEILDELSLLQNLHLCIKRSVCTKDWKLLEKFAVRFLYNRH